jgi:hypothetical protein
MKETSSLFDFHHLRGNGATELIYSTIKYKSLFLKVTDVAKIPFTTLHKIIVSDNMNPLV